MKEPDSLFSSIVTYAARYGLGRRTYAVSEITSFAKLHIRELDDKALGNIKRDILEADQRNGLGDVVIDEPEWKSLVAAIDDEIKRREDVAERKKQALANAEAKRQASIAAHERASVRKQERLEAIEACKIAAVGYIVAEAKAGSRPKMTAFQNAVSGVYTAGVAAAAWHDLERVRSNAIRANLTRDGKAGLKYGRLMASGYRLTYDDIRAISIKSGIKLETLLTMGLDSVDSK